MIGGLDRRSGAVLLLGLLALLGVRFTREHPLPAQARNGILLRLKADYSRTVLDSPAMAGNDRAALSARAAALAQRQNVSIEKSTVRGLLWGKFVRVEVSASGKTPPDGNGVRYFTLDLVGNAAPEVSGWKYYCALW